MSIILFIQQYWAAVLMLFIASCIIATLAGRNKGLRDWNKQLKDRTEVLEDRNVDAEDYKAMLFAFMSKKFPAGLLPIDPRYADPLLTRSICLDLPVGQVIYEYDISVHGELFKHLPNYTKEWLTIGADETKRRLSKMAGPKPAPRTPRHHVEKQTVVPFVAPPPANRTRRKHG